MTWAAAAVARDPDRMLQSIEVAAASVPPERRAELHRGFDPEMIWPLNQHLRSADEAKHKRLVEALVALEWPGPHHRDSAYILRAELARYRLDAGEPQAGGTAGRA